METMSERQAKVIPVTKLRFSKYNFGGHTIRKIKHLSTYGKETSV